MVFEASKARGRKPPDPVAKGKPLRPSAAIRIWYHGRLLDITEAMLADYRAALSASLKDYDVRKAFAMDASASSLLTALLARLWDKWTKVFVGFSDETSKEFVRQSDEHVKASVWGSLSAAGVKQPTTAYNQNVMNTLQAAQSYNNTLIRGIHQDAHEKIYSAVMLSLTSSSPEQQGQSGIENALREMGLFTEKRIQLIAEDQTSKLYSSLSDERMLQNKVDEFEWMHSSAGKEPRASHVRMDGHIFTLNDPRMWEVGGEFGLKKGDLGPPGWAIKCRCTKKPIIR
jgi:uncharacterized protein with gpF-like domain